MGEGMQNYYALSGHTIIQEGSCVHLTRSSYAPIILTLSLHRYVMFVYMAFPDNFFISIFYSAAV
jgi:hypothetical protein